MSAGRLPAGPHDDEPTDLGRLVGALAPDAPEPEVIASRTAAWLRGVLDDAGVDIGVVDRDVVEQLAEDWSTAHVVGGWIARAGAQR